METEQNSRLMVDRYPAYRYARLDELRGRLHLFRDNIQQALRANGHNPDDAIAVEIAVDRLIAEANGTWVGPTSAEQVKSQESRVKSQKSG